MNESKQNQGSVKRIDRPAVLDLKGDKLSISVETPLPPGSRVEISLSTEQSSTSVLVLGKVVSSKPTESGSHLMSVKLHNLTHDQRSMIENIYRHSS